MEMRETSHICAGAIHGPNWETSRQEGFPTIAAGNFQ